MSFGNIVESKQIHPHLWTFCRNQCVCNTGF